MWSEETIERRWRPDVDAYSKDYRDNKPEWKSDPRARHREEAKRRDELEKAIRRVASQLNTARVDARAKSKPREDGAKPTVDSLAARISLIPKLLKEILANPFRDFTLVKRGGEVFVVEKGADLGAKDLSGADLRRADLRGANLEGTLLIQADLEEADLSGANLKNAVLRKANLRKVSLEGAVLDGSDLRGADLWGVKADPATLSRATFEGRFSHHGGSPA